jgi:muconolactone delta-isomerase
LAAAGGRFKLKAHVRMTERARPRSLKARMKASRHWRRPNTFRLRALSAHHGFWYDVTDLNDIGMCTPNCITMKKCN